MKRITYKKKHESFDEFDQFTLELDEVSDPVIKKREEKKDTKPENIWKYVGFASDLGFTIALPIAGGAFIGHWIDQKWSMYPKATLTMLLIGGIISIVGFIRIIVDLIRRKN
jgi:ATP synthase protein I